jgi:hypothetical protein
MSNLTLSIDKTLLKRARIMALKHDTTVNAMIRDYLEREVSKYEKSADCSIEALEKLFAKTEVPIGKITWTRDELHER